MRLYDTQTRSMLQTDQPFPSIGSQKKGVAINPDVSPSLESTICEWTTAARGLGL